MIFLLKKRIFFNNKMNEYLNQYIHSFVFNTLIYLINVLM